MSSMIAMTMALAMSTLAGTKDKTDPVGTWDCTYTIGGQHRTLELTIRKHGDQLAGTMSWPDQKDEKLDDVKLAGDTLTYSVVRKYQGSRFALDLEVKLDGDELAGKAVTKNDAPKLEYAIAGKRRIAAGAADPLGTWSCEYTIGEQRLTLELTIRKDGDQLAGTMSWPDQEDEKLTALKYDSGTLTYSVVRKYQGNEFPLDLELKIEGDELEGTAAAKWEGRTQLYDIAGKRKR